MATAPHRTDGYIHCQGQVSLEAKISQGCQQIFVRLAWLAGPNPLNLSAYFQHALKTLKPGTFFCITLVGIPRNYLHSISELHSIIIIIILSLLTKEK